MIVIRHLDFTPRILRWFGFHDLSDWQIIAAYVALAVVAAILLYLLYFWLLVLPKSK